MPEFARFLFDWSSLMASVTVGLGTITYMWGYLTSDFWMNVKQFYCAAAIAGTTVACILTAVQG